ncbi:MAG: transcription termination factor NusA [Alphaproteobacteria bacterium]|uniref:transcription termination factor NusA n=1 Tax=Candidatus Scatocola faecigallinarum TaxID=2840916 RepID=UPI0003350018|nr:nusA antitermination factor [Azospirillum sp. CAG:239]
MQNIESMPRPEIILVADTVAREKNIDKEDVFTAMEVAIQKAGRSKYGFEHDIRANIDRKTGAISLARYREVVEGPENVENEVTQLTLEDAKMYDANAKVGDFIIDQLPPIDFGRIAAQTAKQVIVQKVRDAERNKQFEEYKEKIGTIVNGTIKRIEFGNVILDIGKTEAILRRDEIIPREKFKNGDRVRAYVLDVRRENKGPQVFLSRTCPEFMAKLFTQEVPEIYDGIVKIMGVARDPGSKAKIAVKTDDMTIDPVGACVGLRGIRVQAVVTELQGEKIDIVPYSEDKAQYIVSALSPAEVTKVVLDEENNRIEAVVPQEQFSLAIGRRGQNVKLASQLLGCDIDVLTEEQEQERRSNENKVRSQRFIEALDVDEMIAHLLIAEGFSTVDEIALVPLSELAEIEGFDEDVAAELQKRAKDFIAKRNEEFAEKSKTLGIDEQLKTVEGLDQDMILTLAGKGVKTLDDLADLAADELMEMLGENVLSEVEANKVIMKAREHWFSEETSL